MSSKSGNKKKTSKSMEGPYTNGRSNSKKTMVISDYESIGSTSSGLDSDDETDIDEIDTTDTEADEIDTTDNEIDTTDNEIDEIDTTDNETDEIDTTDNETDEIDTTDTTDNETDEIDTTNDEIDTTNDEIDTTDNDEINTSDTDTDEIDTDNSKKRARPPRKQIIDKKSLDDIPDILNNINDGQEIKVIFSSKVDNKKTMVYDEIQRILNYMKTLSVEYSIPITDDVSLCMPLTRNDEKYNLTINGIREVERSITQLAKESNIGIIRTLMKEMSSGRESISLHKQTTQSIHRIKDYNLGIKTIKKTKAVSIDKDTQIINQRYKLKHTAVLTLIHTKDCKLSIVVSSQKNANNLRLLSSCNTKYLASIVYRQESQAHKDELVTIIKELLKTIQKSNTLITLSLEKEIINVYNNLLGVNIKKLSNRKVRTLGIQNLVDDLPNNYGVTDKADGQRYFVIIHKGNTYCISNTLQVMNIGCKANSNYNNSILDAEVVLVPKFNKYLILAFDCLFISGEDIRQTSSILTRLEKADEIINNCFIKKGHKGYLIPDFKGKFSVTNVCNFHKKGITEYIDSINHDLSIDSPEPLIRRKYFIPVLGGNPSEIFAYSCLVWETYVLNSRCQYELDGLIYHPLEQRYTTIQRESKYPEYKWKPEDKNSIDFYVTIKRDKNAKFEYEVFDNTQEVKDRPYKICYLHNGRFVRGAERPVPFKEEEGLNIAHIPITQGEIRDSTGTIIHDKTVVEFGYINDMSIKKESRWVPIRVRKDKTELLRKTGKGHGNFNIVAESVWQSMTRPVTLDDIRSLTSPKDYSRNLARLRARVDHSIILSQRRENVYQHAKTILTKTMRGFHNWVKSQLIYTYVNKSYTKGVKQTVLDIGCGRGADIMKFYYTMVDLYVGIDTNASYLLSTVDSAKSRYEQLQKTHPNFPRMLFIQADAGSLFSYDSQRRALGQVSSLNKTLLEQYLVSPKPYDRINCQFNIQNYLSDALTWGNFCTNINNLLKPGGYFIVTCIDGDTIVNLLGANENYSVSYTTDKGEKKMLFDIVKKYTTKSLGPGLCVDFYSLIENQEGEYVTKYLPVKDFIIESLQTHGISLVETDLFKDHYIKNRDFFAEYFKYEENSKTRDFFTEVSKYYSSNSATDKVCFSMTSLYRYYVFRKDEKTQKGGKMKDYTLQFEVFVALKESGLVPKKQTELQFYDDIGINLLSDRAIDTNYINNLADSLVIEHYEKNQSKLLIDGLCIYVVNMTPPRKGILTRHGTNKDKFIVLLKYDNDYTLAKYPRLAPVFDSNEISIETIMNYVYE